MAGGMYRFVPCNIGDTVWALCQRGGKKFIAQGIVREMSFIGEKMDLCIVVGHLLRGRWGENVFPSHDAAKKALDKENDPHYISAAQVRAMSLDEVRNRKKDIVESLKKW